MFFVKDKARKRERVKAFERFECLCLRKKLTKRVCFTHYGCTEPEENISGVKHDVNQLGGQASTLCVNLSKSLNPQGEN